MIYEHQRNFIGANLLQLAGVPGFATGGIVGVPAGENPVIQHQIAQSIDIEAIAKAVREGAKQGSEQGSTQGTQSGIIELANNREVQKQALF